MARQQTQQQDQASWRRFARLCLAMGAGALLFVALFVAIADPYDTLPFSPGFERAPATTNQRFSFPAIAMNPEFDSVVIGTSTTRLLEPGKLNAVLGGRFANLSMNSGMPYEQARILDLFVRHHPSPRTVIFGIDDVWCRTAASPKHTDRPFPPWLYDDNRWNDALHLLNFTGIEQAGRQALQLLGLREEKYRRDGYRNFLPPQDEYDLEKARGHIYGQGSRVLPPSEEAPADGYEGYRSQLLFPDHAILARAAAGLPEATLKIFLIAPVHAVGIAVPGSEREAFWRECVSRLAEIGAAAGNAHVFDFRRRSEITTDDRRYWDSLHYGTATAERIVTLIGNGLAAGRSTDTAYEYRKVEP